MFAPTVKSPVAPFSSRRVNRVACNASTKEEVMAKIQAKERAKYEAAMQEKAILKKKEQDMKAYLDKDVADFVKLRKELEQVELDAYNAYKSENEAERKSLQDTYNKAKQDKVDQKYERYMKKKLKTVDEFVQQEKMKTPAQVAKDVEELEARAAKIAELNSGKLSTADLRKARVEASKQRKAERLEEFGDLSDSAL